MHHLIDFKGFADAQINLLQPFTVLIGRNGSGKSNTIEGIELLSHIAQGRPLYEMTDVGRGLNTFEIRGGLEACGRGERDAFELQFTGMIPFGGHLSHFRYLVRVKCRPEPRIWAESLDIGKNVIFECPADSLQENPGILLVRYHTFARGGKPIKPMTSDRSILSRYEELIEASPKMEAARKAVSGIRNHLKASFTFDPHSKTMRSYERIGQRVLARDGANLSAVLYALEQGTAEERVILQRILKLIQQIPEEPFDSFSFVTTSQRDVLLGFRATERGPTLDARVLSDGTLRCLAVLTALETVAAGSRIVIEEFDNGLHPSRVGILTQAIIECSQRRKLNVLVTTHNPATLNTLKADQLGSVVLCYWDLEQKAAQLLTLSELPRSDSLLERGLLGDLVTRQVVEQYLVPHYEEHHQTKARAWLDSLP